MSGIDLKRTKVPCPGCGSGLVAFTEAGAVFGGCTRCGAMWLDNAAGKMLMEGDLSKNARDFAQQVTARTPAATASSPYRSAERNARSCPVCGAALTATKLRAPPVEIDVCAPHGAYLDGGEIGTIWAEMSVRAAELWLAEDEIVQEQNRRTAAMNAAFAGLDGYPNP